MLVFGDAERTENPREMLARIGERWRAAKAMPGGILRHGAVVCALIEAGELLQGVADAEFGERGIDAPSPGQDTVAALLMAIADAVAASWTGAFQDIGPDGVAAAIGGLAAIPLPDRIMVRSPEGYGFYALYPEAHLEAARRLGSGETQAVGLRSIGTGLAAMVAVGARSRAMVTLRPVGHPFDRLVAPAPELAAALLQQEETRLAIVDEGPGLSGSSLNAVADFLEDGGVDPARICFLPGHSGDLGPQASRRHRERWATAKRHVVSFEELILDSPEPAHRLENWFTDLLGAPETPLEDVSAGNWRRRHFRSEEQWPACHIGQERRKYLLRSKGAVWLLKFSGLGPEFATKPARASALWEAGFTPEPAGYRHGFLAERWIEDARPLDLAGADRSRLVDTVGRYLAFRAGKFPAARRQGASLENLLAMARRNTELALGGPAESVLRRWKAKLPELQTHLRAVETDNRMHAHEWLVLADGRLLKTDALDHHSGHDLVGCQDIAWDIVGAEIELDLTGHESAAIRGDIERCLGREVCTQLHDFYRLCYLAFQIGHCRLAAEALAGVPQERDRLASAEARYLRKLRPILARHSR